MYHELRKPGTRTMPAVPDRRHLMRRVFGIPLLLAVGTLAGLLAALLGQGGLWHVLAWIMLGIPLALLAWCLMRR
jgi:hypothetical protein